jgi:hypothetical protein
MALTGGVWTYRRMKGSTTAAEKTLRNALAAKKQADDELVDAMAEQSFPASDAPAY